MRTWFGADRKVSIERWYLSPYVEKPLNSTVIKSFVPELRSRKCFLCFGIPVCVMNILCTFHISVSWECFISTSSKKQKQIKAESATIGHSNNATQLRTSTNKWMQRTSSKRIQKQTWQKLSKRLKFGHVDKWNMHKPESVQENTTQKFYRTAAILSLIFILQYVS